MGPGVDLGHTGEGQMRLFTLEAELQTFGCWSLGFEIGGSRRIPLFVLISFAKWTLDISLKVGEPNE